MATCSSFGVADHNKSSGEMAEAEYSRFTIIPASILDFKSEALKSGYSVLKIKPTLIKRTLSLGRITLL